MELGEELNHLKIRKKINKNNFIKFALLLFSILLSITLIEIYLTKINYPYQDCKVVNQSAEAYLGEFNSQTGWSYKRQISYYEQNDKYQYHFNDSGIRSKQVNYKVDWTKPRILFIGGSVTFGEELNYEDTFPALIGALLEDRFEVVNLGIQGFGTAQSMLRLKGFVEDFSPQYIVYTFIGDHINRDINYDRRLHVKCYRFSGTKPVFVVDKGKLKKIRKPQTYDKVDRFKTLLFLSMSYQNFQEQKLIKTGDSKIITKEIINEISKLAKENNAQDYYIYYDTTYNLSNNNWNDYLSAYMFGDSKEDRVLNFFNWASDSQFPGTKYYSNEDDDIHPNASLSAEIAKRFVDKFGGDFSE